MEWVSVTSQIGAGIVICWSAWQMRKVPAYRWAFCVLGAVLLYVGVVGFLSITYRGGVVELVEYRRPAFIVERVLTALIVVRVVFRHKLLNYGGTTDDA